MQEGGGFLGGDSRVAGVETTDIDCVDVWQEVDMRNQRFLGQASVGKARSVSTQRVGKWEVGEDGVLKKFPISPGVVLHVFIKSTTNLGYF